MKKINLNDSWKITFNSTGKCFNAHVPVSVFNSLLQCGEIEDPFYKSNENKAIYISETDKTFSREFELSDYDLQHKNIILSCKSLDTLACIYINWKKAAETSNAYISHEIKIKDFLNTGKNNIEIKFSSPVNYVKEMQKNDPLPRNANGINGVAHIRKPACHFGWDWGINMQISGITGDIELIACNDEIRDFSITQIHEKSSVTLKISTDIQADEQGAVEYPNGEIKKFEIKSGKAEIKIENPELWWTKELSEKEKQPLYKITINDITKNGSAYNRA
ncbi:MAG: hypothetical protein LIO43_04255 [Clostridiales bacterium]|nr:hypothetical protein [Clostridiales bacterium]